MASGTSPPNPHWGPACPQTPRTPQRGYPPSALPRVEECTYFWGVNTSWGINTTESKRPLNQEDNQAPQPTVGPSIPMIDNSQSTTKNIGVRMYSSLMGTFDFMAPIHHVYAMSSRPVLSMRSIPFCTSYFSDPWTLPSPTSSCEG